MLSAPMENKFTDTKTMVSFISMVLFHLQMVMFQTTQKGDWGFDDYWKYTDFRAGTPFAGIPFGGRRQTGGFLRQSGRLGERKTIG